MLEPFCYVKINDCRTPEPDCIFLNSSPITHPLPHKVVSQISSQHVRAKSCFHYTRVDLKHERRVNKSVILPENHAVWNISSIFASGPWELTWLQSSPAAQHERYRSSQTWPPCLPEGWTATTTQNMGKKIKTRSDPSVKGFIPAGLCCRCWAGPSVSSWIQHTEKHISVRTQVSQ